MATEKFTYVCPKTGLRRECPINGKLKKNLDKIKRELEKKDRDKFIVVIGIEESGKSE